MTWTPLFTSHTLLPFAVNDICILWCIANAENWFSAIQKHFPTIILLHTDRLDIMMLLCPSYYFPQHLLGAETDANKFKHFFSKSFGYVSAVF